MSDDKHYGSAASLMDPPQPPSSIPHHRPVMVSEVLDVLRPQSGETLLDLTVGTAGHALALGRRLGSDGLIIGVDADREVLRTARDRLSQECPCPFRLFQAPFSRAPQVLQEAQSERVDMILADLGVGPQLDDPSRGFSFDSESRLDMRYDPRSGPSAWEVVNRASERQLTDIFYKLGEERRARRIAAEICRRRGPQTIDTPAEFAELVKQVAARDSRRGRTWRIHPATRAAMALRIYVNDELGELERLLECLPSLLNASGRAAVLTYHSLEARRVKHTWQRQQQQGRIRVLTKHPIKPTQQEVDENPRSRSAQLRACTRPEHTR